MRLKPLQGQTLMGAGFYRRSWSGNNGDELLGNVGRFGVEVRQRLIGFFPAKNLAQCQHIHDPRHSGGGGVP